MWCDVGLQYLSCLVLSILKLITRMVMFDIMFNIMFDIMFIVGSVIEWIFERGIAGFEI